MPGPARLSPAPAALAALCLALPGTGAAQEGPSSEPLEVRFALRSFTVEAVVPASGAELTPGERRHGRRWIGVSALFNADPTARQGESVITHGVPDRGEPGSAHTSLCSDWGLRPLDRRAPRDAALREALPEDVLSGGTWAALRCGGRDARRLYVLEEGRAGYLTRVMDGRAWLIWRPEPDPQRDGAR